MALEEDKGKKEIGMEKIPLFLICPGAGVFTVQHPAQFAVVEAEEFLLLCWGHCVRP